jgi:hypothetical protein
MSPLRYVFLRTRFYLLSSSLVTSKERGLGPDCWGCLEVVLGLRVGGVMGLKDGFDCGVWEDDGEDLGLAEGESSAGERS